MSVIHSCGCKDPRRAFLVQYEAEDCDADTGFHPVIVTASMCEYHTLCQITYGQLISAKRLDE